MDGPGRVGKAQAVDAGTVGRDAAIRDRRGLHQLPARGRRRPGQSSLRSSEVRTAGQAEEHLRPDELFPTQREHQASGVRTSQSYRQIRRALPCATLPTRKELVSYTGSRKELADTCRLPSFAQWME